MNPLLQKIKSAPKSAMTGVLVYFIFSVILFLTIGQWDGNEGLMSSIYAGNLLPASKDYLLLDTPLLLEPFFYNIHSKLTNKYQLHAYFTFIICFISIVSINSSIRSFLRKNNFNKLYLLFIYILIFIILLPNLLLISTTRNAVLLFLAFATNVVIYGKIKSNQYVILFLAIIMRLDAVVLLSFFLGLFLCLKDKNIKIRNFISFTIALCCYIVLNVTIRTYSSDSFQSFYFYELEIFDKTNYIVDQISSYDYAQLYYFINYGILNEKIFDPDFYERILNTNYSHIFNSIFDIRLYKNALVASIPELMLSLGVVSTCFILLLFVVYFIHNIKDKFIAIIIFLLPSLACFYILIPNRFLTPYYGFVMIMYLVFLFWRIKDRLLMTLFAVLIVLGVTYDILKNYELGVHKQKIYDKTMLKLEEIDRVYPNEKIYVGNLFSQEYLYFPISVNVKMQHINAHFINYLYFAAFSSYSNDWKATCKCNPYSFKEKVEFIAYSGSKILLEERMVKIYKEYFLKLTGAQLNFSRTNPNIDDLYKIHIIYN